MDFPLTPRDVSVCSASFYTAKIWPPTASPSLTAYRAAVWAPVLSDLWEARSRDKHS